MVNVFTTHQLWIAAFCEMDEPFSSIHRIADRCAAKPGLDRAQSTGGFRCPAKLLYPANRMLRRACPRARKLRRLSKRYQDPLRRFVSHTHLTVRAHVRGDPARLASSREMVGCHACAGVS